MRNAVILALVLASAAASIVLATLVESTRSPLVNRTPLVPGVSAWMKTHGDG